MIICENLVNPVAHHLACLELLVRMAEIKELDTKGEALFTYITLSGRFDQASGFVNSEDVGKLEGFNLKTNISHRMPHLVGQNNPALGRNLYLIRKLKLRGDLIPVLHHDLKL